MKRDEAARALERYDRADEAIRRMNRENLKTFGALKLARFDELHIIREVEAVYKKAVKRAREEYEDLALWAYVEGAVACGMAEDEARRRAKESVGPEWVELLLTEPDAVTKYAFLPEAERKERRLIEALTVAQDRPGEVDRALRYWAGQIGQYAVTVTDAARLEAFSDAGVVEVMWNTEEDDRVCRDCEPLDGQVFPIEEVPDKPHFGCRCRLTPVLNDD